MKSQKIQRQKLKPFAHHKYGPYNVPPIYYPRPGRRTIQRGWLLPSETCANPKVKYLASKAGFYLSLLHEYAAAAQELNELRERWLNPPEWTREEILEFPASADGPWSRYVVGRVTPRGDSPDAVSGDTAYKIALARLPASRAERRRLRRQTQETDADQSL